MQLDALYVLAKTLLTCAAEALAETDAGAPARSCVIAGGEAIWDACCDGQLTVHVERDYATTTFPIEENTVTPCSSPFLAATLIVTVVRCAPVPDQNGNAPTCEALDAAARIAYTDAIAVRRAIQCCLGDLAEGDIDSLIGPQTFLEEGACLGSRSSVTVELTDPCICG